MEIVISGISGRFPEADSVAEFSEKLFQKVNLLVEDNRRWEQGLYDLPRRMGMLKDISKFDNQFFKVHNKQAEHLDPQIRIFLEVTYESIVDSGFDPDELRGRNIGVFVGSRGSETLDFSTRDINKVNGFSLIGCTQSMQANRVSYVFDFKGPSFQLNTACSSSGVALYEAVNAIKNNECESAIVGGINLCLKPAYSLMYRKLNMLSDDGLCKSFDESANGYGRSEAIVALFIQKSTFARRKYASIIHIKINNDGYKSEGITFPSKEGQKQLIKKVYEECKLDNLEVSYVEAHGTGTSVGDLVEMTAISETYCFNRKESLLVGSVKSNMGHSEHSSGLCGIIKILIGMQNQCIPPNLHFHKPNPSIESLITGKVKVPTVPTPWNGEYAAFNNFGFGGVNVHAVLKSNSAINKNNLMESNELPQLVLFSGRTNESVQYLFSHLDDMKMPREFFALLHKSVYTTFMKPYRGYKIKDEFSEIKKLNNQRRPVWFVFSGMGCQWPNMAKQMMDFKVFANSIRKSAEVLKPHGINLVDLVMNFNASDDRNILPAFISITAIQIALVDLLHNLGIEPDGIIGHSLGETCCAYLDGSLNAEQTLLCAFWRGKCVENSQLIEGSVAATGLTWKEAKSMCPADIFPVCHNAEDSVAISGPKESVKKFITTLKSKGVFVKEIETYGYAFHSKYIYPVADSLQGKLNPVRKFLRKVAIKINKIKHSHATEIREYAC